MKRCLLTFIGSLTAAASLNAQTPITITDADMPVKGDTLRYSAALPNANLQLSNTGAGINWDYSLFVPLTQAVDTYKTAATAGYTGGSPSIPATAFGYKIADTLTFPGAPVSATNVYTFFNTKTSPSRFVAEGFGAKLNGLISLSSGYSNEDTIYNFPLTFNRLDSSTFKIAITVPLLGSLKQQGKRKTVVDGWGTLQTPFFTTAVPVLRVRSEVEEVDSITYNGTSFAIPRHYVDYKWLAAGQHYPALWITTNITGTTETPASVRYRDTKRALGVMHPTAAMELLQVYPNPASGNEAKLQIPDNWGHYVLRVYDVAGRLVLQTDNTPKINTSALAAGKYIIVAENGVAMGVAQFVK